MEIVPPPAQEPSSRRPTIREVARVAGVSPMTVSRVLTGRGYVAAATASRVRAAFERLDYRPNPLARLLRGRRSQLIGVTVPSLTSSVHRGIIAGLEEVLGPADYQMILGHLQAGRRPSTSFVEIARAQHCDGLVIVPSRADVGHPGAGELDRPTVVAFSQLPAVAADAVLSTGREAAQAATRYLLERFGGPVAFVGLDTGLSHEQWLLAGYHDALAGSGQAPCRLTVSSTEEPGRDGIRALLAGERPPRALLLASTHLVFDGLGELVQAGRAIGADIGVVAVATDERPWTALLPRPIPLLLIPAREIGRRAGRLLLRRLDDPTGEPVTELVALRFALPD